MAGSQSMLHCFIIHASQGYHNGKLYSTLHVAIACFATRIPQCHTIYSRLHTMHTMRILQCKNTGCNTVFVRGTSQVHTAFMHIAHSTRCTIVPAVNKLHITSQSVNTIGSHCDIGHIKIQPVYTMVHTILGTFYVMCHTI